MKPSIVRVLPRFGQPGRDELAGHLRQGDGELAAERLS